MVLYCIILYYIVLYYTILCFIILYYIILFDAGVVRCRSSLLQSKTGCLAQSLRDSGAKNMQNVAGTGRSQHLAAHTNRVVRRLMQGMLYLTSKAYAYTYVYTHVYMYVYMYVCMCA